MDFNSLVIDLKKLALQISKAWISWINGSTSFLDSLKSIESNLLNNNSFTSSNVNIWFSSIILDSFNLASKCFKLKGTFFDK